MDNQPKILDKAFDSNWNKSLTFLNTLFLVGIFVLYFFVLNKVNIRENETEEEAIERGRKRKNIVVYTILGTYFVLCLIQTIISIKKNGILTIWYLIIYLLGPIFGLVYAFSNSSSGTALSVL